MIRMTLHVTGPFVKAMEFRLEKKKQMKYLPIDDIVEIKLADKGNLAIEQLTE